MKRKECNSGTRSVYCHHDGEIKMCSECWPCAECYPCCDCYFDECPFSPWTSDAE